MRIGFLGNNSFSLCVLKKILQSGNHTVACCVCNLDKASGRGQQKGEGEVKHFALENGIPVLQYKNVSNGGDNDLCLFNLDVLVSASFGQILKPNILELTKFGVINVHTSLLPKYRGSCPANWVILNGEKTTGITIMQTALALDSGDIFCQKQIDILPDETAGELLSRMAPIAGDLLVQTLNQLEQNIAKATKQNEDEASYYPMLKKDMGKIDFCKTASQIQNFCNGLNPWPLAFVEVGEQRLKVFKAIPQPNKWDLDLTSKKMGEVVCSTSKTGLVVRCADGLVLLSQIQAPNSKVMTSQAFLNGNKIATGTLL